MKLVNLVLFYVFSQILSAGCVSSKGQEPIDALEFVNLKCQSKDICLEAGKVSKMGIDRIKDQCAELKADFIMKQTCTIEHSVGSCQHKSEPHVSPLKPIDSKNKDLALLNLKENDDVLGSRMGLKYFFYAPLYSEEYVQRFCARKDLVYVAP